MDAFSTASPAARAHGRDDPAAAGRRCFCSILPPHLLRELLRRGTPRQQDMAWRTLTVSERFRGERAALTPLAAVAATPAGRRLRTVYDAGRAWDLPGRLVRSEGDPPAEDPAVNEAYDGAGAAYDFYAEVLGRNSLDGRGLRLDATVHYGRDYANAFWNGRQMVYGDGDGELFRRFTVALDVIGHELTHGVVQFEADLEYEGQSGALNESFADVFGSLVKQRALGQTAAEADWLVGAGLFTEAVRGRALRSLKEPGTAYDDPVLGRDPQPAHMRDYVETDEDNGGVHVNSGIPNKAFYEVAVRLGGFAWERAGRIWYHALTERLSRRATFQEAADATLAAAVELYGLRSPEAQAVREGWAAVGIRARRGLGRGRRRRRRDAPPRAGRVASRGAAPGAGPPGRGKL